MFATHSISVFAGLVIGATIGFVAGTFVPPFVAKSVFEGTSTIQWGGRSYRVNRVQVSIRGLRYVYSINYVDGERTFKIDSASNLTIKDDIAYVD
jgi:hypothetical protein